MKNILNLYYSCIYFKKRPKNDLVLFRFVLYTPQGLKTYQSCWRSFQVNSFRVLADSAVSQVYLSSCNEFPVYTRLDDIYCNSLRYIKGWKKLAKEGRKLKRKINFSSISSISSLGSETFANFWQVTIFFWVLLHMS